MMTQIAKSVLLLSVCGGVLGLVLLLIKPITKRFFSPSWQFYIWLVVLAIFVFPVSFSLPAKVPDAQAVTQTAQNTVIDDALKRNTENTVPVSEAQETPVRRQTNPAKAAWLVFAALWLLGAIGTFLHKIIHYALFVRAVNQNSFPDCGKTVLDGAVRRTACYRRVLPGFVSAGKRLRQGRPALYSAARVDTRAAARPVI